MAVNIGVNIQRSPNRINQALRAAGVNGQYPKLLFDFDDEYYLTNGSSKTFANAMTFARAGLATMVDSDGLIKWAPHNLLSYSEQFDNAAWNKSYSTITANATIAPDGNETADLLVRTSDGARTSRVHTATNEQDLVFSVFTKDSSGDGCRILAYNNTKAGSIKSITLSDISVGVDSGGGWFRQDLDIATNDGVGFSSGDSVIFLIYSDSAAGFTEGSSIYLWGAHLYRSDLGGMVDNPDRGDSYVPTTSSAVYLPRRGHHKYNGDQWVNKGLLVESEARTNLLDYSIPDSNWSASSVLVNTDQAVSPDGNTSATQLLATGANSFPTAFKSCATTGSVTGSVYCKKGTSSFCYIRFNGTDVGGSGQTSSTYKFTFSEESLARVSGGTADSTFIEKLANGWYRIGFTLATTSVGSFALYPEFNSSSITDVYVYGAQVEAASTPSSYIPTNGSSVTRAAETVTVPYANLPWPTPTYIGDELVTNGTFDTDVSGWTAGDAASFLSVSSGSLVIENGDAGPAYATQTLSQEVGKVYAVTFTVTVPTGEYARILFAGYDSGSAWPSGTYTVFVVAQNSLDLILSNSSVSGLGESTQWDNISVREINPLSVSIAMMGEMTYADTAINQEIVFVSHYENSGNYIIYELGDSGAATGKVGFFQVANSVTDVVASGDTAYSYGINVPFNISGRNGSTFVNGAVDGIALTANTTPVALPDLSTTDLKIAGRFSGTISEFRIWDKDLGDAGIAEATKPSLEPSLSLTFDGQPSSFTNTGVTV